MGMEKLYSYTEKNGTSKDNEKKGKLYRTNNIGISYCHPTDQLKQYSLFIDVFSSHVFSTCIYLIEYAPI